MAHAAVSIDAALATALDRASAAGEWATVALLAGELAARRIAAAAQPPAADGGSALVVVDIEAARRKRDGR